MPDRRVEQVQRIVGSNIRRARKRLRMTQAELAAAAGVESRTVQRLEAADTSSLATIVGVADALGVPVASLFRATKPLARRPAGRPKAH